MGDGGWGVAIDKTREAKIFDSVVENFKSEVVEQKHPPNLLDVLLIGSFDRINGIVSKADI